MNDVLVSICIPVYNGEQTIATTMESVLSQTYKNIEIIVVDNCSDDRTAEIVAGFKDQRIRYYRNETNLGMVGNWNKCIDYITGEYVLFVCADDLLHKDSVYKKAKVLSSKEDTSIVFSASNIINHDGKILMHRHTFKKNCIISGKQIAKMAYHRGNIYGEPTNVMIRMKSLDKVGKFASNTYYSTDLEMWLRLSAVGNVGYINDELMSYRVASVNETSKIQFKRKMDDDKNLMINIHKSKLLKISKMDDIIHRVNIVFRTIARSVYMMLFC